MRSVDTNVLVRLFTGDTPSQAASADDFVRDGAWVSLLALAESIWVLRTYYSADVAAQHRAIAMVLNHQSLIVQDSEVATAALERFRVSPAIGFSDCLLLEIAHRAGHTPLATFDKRLAKEAGTIALG